MGIEPTPNAWKAPILAFIRYPQVGGSIIVLTAVRLLELGEQFQSHAVSYGLRALYLNRS